MPAVTRRVHAIDPAQPVAASTTIRGIVSDELARPRLNALLAVAFGFAGPALATLGISAALAESISRRKAELGVRLALGSSPRLFGVADPPAKPGALGCEPPKAAELWAAHERPCEPPEGGAPIPASAGPVSCPPALGCGCTREWPLRRGQPSRRSIPAPKSAAPRSSVCGRSTSGPRGSCSSP